MEYSFIIFIISHCFLISYHCILWSLSDEAVDTPERYLFYCSSTTIQISGIDTSIEVAVSDFCFLRLLPLLLRCSLLVHHVPVESTNHIFNDSRPPIHVVNKNLNGLKSKKKNEKRSFSRHFWLMIHSGAASIPIESWRHIWKSFCQTNRWQKLPTRPNKTWWTFHLF